MAPGRNYEAPGQDGNHYLLTITLCRGTQKERNQNVLSSIMLKIVIVLSWGEKLKKCKFISHKSSHINSNGIKSSTRHLT